MNKKDNLYHVIILGGGPAGLTAAIYLARAKYRVLVLEKEEFGGQIKITDEIVNYPGILKTDGKTLTDTMRTQARNFGAEFSIADIKDLNIEGDIKVIKTSKGELRALGVLIATGANPRTLGFKGEAEFKGRGVAYCATCDGEFFSGKDVVVVGGGFAAAEEAIFLTKYARKVTMLIRKGEFSCAKSVAETCMLNPKIEVRLFTEIEGVGGEKDIRYVKTKDAETGEKGLIKSQDGTNLGVFVFAGYVPASDFVKGIVNLDDKGYIITDKGQKTSLEGVYAAGDICIKPLRQVVTAVSDGAIAATELEKHVSKMQQKTELFPKIPEREGIAEEQTVDSNSTEGERFLNPQIREQLKGLMSKFQKNLVLKVYKNEEPVSDELEGAMRELGTTGNKLRIETLEAEEAQEKVPIEERPFVSICYEDGKPSGAGFHGVPGGHEFQSFVVGLYNGAGPGQELEDDLIEQIKNLPETQLQIIVSLTCTQCPDLVTAAQKIAFVSDNVTADVYDVNHFSELKEKYDIMSVPCLIVNGGEKVSFGKKNIEELIDLCRR